MHWLKQQMRCRQITCSRFTYAKVGAGATSLRPTSTLCLTQAFGTAVHEGSNVIKYGPGGAKAAEELFPDVSGVCRRTAHPRELEDWELSFGC